MEKKFQINLKIIELNIINEKFIEEKTKETLDKFLFKCKRVFNKQK